MEEFTKTNLIWKLLQYDLMIIWLLSCRNGWQCQHRFSNLAANNEPNFHITSSRLSKKIKLKLYYLILNNMEHDNDTGLFSWNLHCSLLILKNKYENLLQTSYNSASHSILNHVFLLDQAASYILDCKFIIVHISFIFQNIIIHL